MNALGGIMHGLLRQVDINRVIGVEFVIAHNSASLQSLVKYDVGKRQEM